MSTKRTKVVPLPLTKARATEIVRSIAKDSRRWVVTVQYRDDQEWRNLVNRRQIELCLKEGYVLEKKIGQDEHGNWRFRIARVCAGQNVVLDVAIESEGALPNLYVLGITGDSI